MSALSTIGDVDYRFRRNRSQRRCHRSSVDRSSTGASVASRGHPAPPGTNLRNLRLAKGCQEAFADEAGIHRTYVSDIERGARKPTITVVEKLAMPFGVTAAALLE